MNEATVVRAIVDHLRERLPGAVVFKHNDRITAGIPDVSVTYGGRTTWLEVKLIGSWNDSPSSLMKKFDALQLATMLRLADARAGQAYYLVAYEGKKKLDVILPREVKLCRDQLNFPPVTYSSGSFKDVMYYVVQELQHGKQGS